MSDAKLPSGWVESVFTEHLQIQGGQQPPKSEFIFEEKEGYIRLLQIRDFGAKPVLNYIPISKKNKLCEKEDILIARYGASLGRICTGMSGAYNVALAKVITPAYVDKKYLKYFLNSTYFQYPLALLSRSAQNGFNKDDLERFPFIIAPLAEQKEIARLVEQHLAQVEQIKAHLEAIPKLITTFRQSVLADAVNGKLTTDWRGNNDINQWGSSPLKDVCLKVQSGSTPKNKPFDQGGTIPFLKVYNIVDQKVDFGYKPQFITSEVHKQKSKRSITLPNDVLMNIVGPPLCKVAIVTDEYPEWNLNQAITLFRADPKKLNYRFLYYFLREGRLVRDVTHDLKGSVGQVNISLTQCRESTINYPSLLEQNEIVSRVEELFTFADNIERQVQSATEHVNLLTQSILAKAFRGELTADWRKQNPELISGDNSAEALLARIQAQMKSSKAKTKAMN